MFIFLSIILTIVAVLLVVVILMQSSNGGGALDGLGGNLASNVFGGQAMNEGIKKFTAILATIFAALCLFLAWYVAKGDQVKSFESELSNKAKKELNKTLPEETAPVQVPTEKKESTR